MEQKQFSTNIHVTLKASLFIHHFIRFLCIEIMFDIKKKEVSGLVFHFI